MYTIGEFSKIGKVSTKMLRHYDKIGLLLPKQINSENGYRYYAHDQVKDIILINKLKGYKFSLKEITELINSMDTQTLHTAMKEKLKVIRSNIQSYQTLLVQMEDEILRLEKGGFIMESREFKILKDQQDDKIIVSVRDKTSMSQIGVLIGRAMELVYGNQLKQAGPLFTKYFDEDFDKEHADVEVCIPVDKGLEGITKIHKGDICVHTKFVGPYSEISEAYAAILDYIKENGLKVCRPPYESYLKGPGSNVEPKDFVTEIYFPVE